MLILFYRNDFLYFTKIWIKQRINCKTGLFFINKQDNTRIKLKSKKPKN